MQEWDLKETFAYILIFILPIYILFVSIFVGICIVDTVGASIILGWIVGIITAILMSIGLVSICDKLLN